LCDGDFTKRQRENFLPSNTIITIEIINYILRTIYTKVSIELMNSTTNYVNEFSIKGKIK